MLMPFIDSLLSKYSLTNYAPMLFIYAEELLTSFK